MSGNGAVSCFGSVDHAAVVHLPGDLVFPGGLIELRGIGGVLIRISDLGVPAGEGVGILGVGSFGGRFTAVLRFHAVAHGFGREYIIPVLPDDDMADDEVAAAFFVDCGGVVPVVGKSWVDAFFIGDGRHFDDGDCRFFPPSLLFFLRGGDLCDHFIGGKVALVVQ